MKNLAELLENVQTQLATLSERVELLEAGSSTQPADPADEPRPEVPLMAAAPETEPSEPELTEEELLAISAAIAAFMGVRVHIRQIRLLSSRSWAQQGRVSIQASHNVHN